MGTRQAKDLKDTAGVDRRQNKGEDGAERRSGRDRRGARRVPLSLELAVPVLVRGPDGLQHGLARNFSEGGMLIQLRELPPIGSQLEITLHGPTGPAEASVVLPGEVRHQVSWKYQAGGVAGTFRGVGVRFLERREASLEPALVSRGPRILH